MNSRMICLAAMLTVLGLNPLPGHAQSHGHSALAPVASGRSTLTEDFNEPPPKGWYYSCKHQFIQENGGSILRTSGGGHAIWNGAGKVQDFVLTFRYRFIRGEADISFRSLVTHGGHEFYCLTLCRDRVILGRRPHGTAGTTFKALASKPHQIQPNKWHSVTVDMSGAQIRVSVDGAAVLSAVDPQPLPPGPIGLGLILNSGYVDYDDVVLKKGPAAAQTTGAPQAGRRERGSTSATPINIP